MKSTRISCLFLLFAMMLTLGCTSEGSEEAAKVQDLEKALQVMQAEKVETQEKLIAATRKAEVYEKLAERNLEIRDDLENALASLIESKAVTITQRRGLLVVQMPDDILFKMGESDLKDEANDTLNQLASSLKDLDDRHILVAGHTDNIPVTGTLPNGTESNWELSAARGLAVAKALIQRGVSAKKLAPAGFSKFDPVASNDTEQGRAQNRRVELLLMPDLTVLNQQQPTRTVQR